MALTFNLLSVRDLFAKLQRDAALLREEVTSDRLFNFVVTGYSMIDWVEKDPNVAPGAVARDLRDDHCLKVCGHLATACKHFTLDRRKPVTASATSARGYGVGGYGKGGYGVGEESIQVQLNDGKGFQCLDLMENVLATWQNLIAPHTFSGQESQRLECDSGLQDLRDPEERACMGSILASACSANSTVDWAFELRVDL